MTNSIDYYAHISKIRGWNATYKVLLSVTVLILCIALNQVLISVIVLLAMSYLTVWKGKLPVIEYLRVLSIPLTFIILGTLPIALDVSKMPLGEYRVHLGFFYLFTSGIKIKQMLVLMLKVFAAVSALQMLTFSTPSSEIISVLRKAHVPKLVIELMYLIYRYIFILLEVHDKMKHSADSRQGYSDFKTSCVTFGNVASNLLVLSLKKANTYYDAMESRCYDGDLLFLEVDKKVTAGQVLIASLFTIVLLLVGMLLK